MRVLILGWPSFLHGEATAGDVAAMQHVAAELRAAGLPLETAWSPVLYPHERHIDQADPERYTHVVFVCGPVHGQQVREVHQRYAHCERIAVGVTVIDENDPAVTGFDHVLPRDAPGRTPHRDLAAGSARPDVPVVGIVLAPEQPEYSVRRRHTEVHTVVRSWCSRVDCAPIELDTRLDTRNGLGLLCSTPAQFSTVIARTDVVLTTRLHGLVFALDAGVPALAVDPVAGGGKVWAQAAAWKWPAVLSADDLHTDDRIAHERLDKHWAWCRSANGTALAQQRAASRHEGNHALLAELIHRTRHSRTHSAVGD